MAEFISMVRPANDEEDERYRRLRAADLAGDFSWLQTGANAAHDIVLPAISAGHYGFTGREMERKIRAVLRAALSALNDVSDDDRFLYRLGFEAVALQGKDDALVAVGVGAGLALALAAAVTTPHALAMPAPSQQPRRLRPEDFGALPTRPRS